MVGGVSSTILTADVERLLAGLDAAQARAVMDPSPVLAIQAGAGSGKTRVLTRRIARRVVEGSADPKHVLALTFTNKAAGEMRSRLAGLLGEEAVRRRQRYLPRRTPGPTVVTFHRLGSLILERWATDHGEYRRKPTRRRLGLMAEALEGIREETLTPEALGREVEWAKGRMITPEDYAAAAGAARRAVVVGPEDVDLGRVAAAYAAYERLKRRRMVLDVDDFVVEAIRTLESDPGFLAGRRYWHRHMFVDEYQDLNPREFRLLRALVGDDPDLCVVGDPNQAIYGWNGADPTLLLNFTTHFPGASVVRLDANYRCRAPIVEAAAAVLGVPAPQVRPDAEEGPLPALWSFADERAEAEGVARAVTRLVRDYGPGGVAVLAPFRAQLLPVAGLLRSAGVPTEMVGASLLDEPEVKAVIAYLRRFGPVKRGRPLVEIADDVRDLCERSALGIPFDDPPWAYEETVEEPDPDDPEVAARQANLDGFVDLLDEFYDAQPRGDFESFVEWAATVLSRREVGMRGGGVKLSTVHSAKGLEWRAVVVMGLVEGALPSRQTRTPAALEESRRLLYVALTRASDELACTWSVSRSVGSGRVETEPSRFLARMPRRDGDEGIRRVQAYPGQSDPEAARRFFSEWRGRLGKPTGDG